jgi:hypothetical protein
MKLLKKIITTLFIISLVLSFSNAKSLLISDLENKVLTETEKESDQENSKLETAILSKGEQFSPQLKIAVKFSYEKEKKSSLFDNVLTPPPNA